MRWWVRDWFVDEGALEKYSGIQRLNGWLFLLAALLSGTTILSGAEPNYLPSTSWAVGLYALVGLLTLGIYHLDGRRRDALDAFGTVVLGVAALQFAALPSLTAPTFHYPAYVFLVFGGVTALFRGAAVASGSYRRERDRWNRLLTVLGVVAVIGFVAALGALFWPAIRGWV